MGHVDKFPGTAGLQLYRFFKKTLPGILFKPLNNRAILPLLFFGGLIFQSLLPCAAEGRPWNEIKSWGYQLQGIQYEKLMTSPFDLLVIDYSRDGSDSQRFTREEINKLKGNSKNQRLILAYLSIGEAETYRYYWEKGWESKRPGWLDRENPDWPGNYKVRYWDSEWQRIIFGYLDKIIAAGFDGVYLDIIDAYEYFEEQGRDSAADEMKELVKRIASYSREVKGDKEFGIFPQNGEELLTDSGYLSVITGIGREGTYFGYEKENLPSPDKESARIERFLDMAINADKLVLNVDYTTDNSKMADSYRRAMKRGYVEYCATRELDRLVPQPWFLEVY